MLNIQQAREKIKALKAGPVMYERLNKRGHTQILALGELIEFKPEEDYEYMSAKLTDIVMAEFLLLYHGEAFEAVRENLYWNDYEMLMNYKKYHIKRSLNNPISKNNIVSNIKCCIDSIQYTEDTLIVRQRSLDINVAGYSDLHLINHIALNLGAKNVKWLIGNIHKYLNTSTVARRIRTVPKCKKREVNGCLFIYNKTLKLNNIIMANNDVTDENVWNNSCINCPSKNNICKNTHTEVKLINKYLESKNDLLSDELRMIIDYVPCKNCYDYLKKYNVKIYLSKNYNISSTGYKEGNYEI